MRFLRLSWLSLGGMAVAVAGCAGQRLPAVPSALADRAAGAAAAPVHADVASLGWLAGRWASDDAAAEETWTPASDALWGVSWRVDSGRTVEWEASIVARDHAGRVVYRAMPNG